MIKHHAKSISNILKIIIVGFIFFNYMYQSKIAGHPLTSDECKGLLFVAIAGFMILLPIDSSIFIKNLNNIQKPNYSAHLRAESQNPNSLKEDGNDDA